MMAWSCCPSCSAADDGCVFGGRHPPLLRRGGCAGAASWPTRLVHGVHQFFGTWFTKLQENILIKLATIQPSPPAVLTSSIFQPARGHAIMILFTARGKMVSRCVFTICSTWTRAITTRELSVVYK